MALGMCLLHQGMCLFNLFIYFLVYELVFLDVSGTLYIILQKIKLNWAQCPENVSTPLKIAQEV